MCPHCHRLLLVDYVWWVSTKHCEKKKGAACGGQYDWRNPNRVRVKQDSMDRSEAKVFRAQAPPQGACENLVSARKLLASQHDSPVQVLVEGLQEQCRLNE